MVLDVSETEKVLNSSRYFLSTYLPIYLFVCLSGGKIDFSPLERKTDGDPFMVEGRGGGTGGYRHK